MNRKFEGGLQVLALVFATLLFAFWSLGSARSSAEEVLQPTAATAHAPGNAARGRVAYRLYCASCHGQAAQGDGPVAPFLKTPPVDLTRLAAGNEGTFPVDRVFAKIDGRDAAAVPTHGPSDMPVWGMSFQDPAKDTDQEAGAQAKIADLVAFLETVQK
jgi:mono/diheme cytochrome c family protein